MKLPLIPREKVAGAAANIRTGNKILNTAGASLHAAADIGKGVVNTAGRLLAPAPEAIANPLLSAANSAGNAIMKSPTGQWLAGATLLGAPILSHALNEGTSSQENELMHMRRDPTRTVTAADLGSFLEKVAAMPNDPFKGNGSPVGAGHAYPRPHGTTSMSALSERPQAHGGGVGNEFMKGVGNSVGKSLTDTVMGVVLNGATALSDFLINDGRRKRLVDSLCRTDPMLSDAIKRDPKQSTHILEAYQTLVTFAPGIALDINAVRSFLHEAVVSGGSINYATVKNLVDTQKSIAGLSQR